MNLKKDFFLKMNLQHFAEEGEKNSNEGEGNQDQQNEDKQENKPLTLEDVQKLIQSETDKVRTEYTKRLKEKETELEGLQKEKMTEQERKEFELNKLQSELERERNELRMERLNNKAADLLAEKGLPANFKKWIVASDEESTVKNVTDFESAWNEALKAAVESRFKENGYKPGEGTGTTVKNPFKQGEHFNLTEQGKLFRTNPELARKLQAEA